MSQSKSVAPMAMQMVQDDETINFGEYLGVFLHHKWSILTITGIGLLLGIAYAMLATPVYRADALIQIEDENVGGLPALEDVAGLFEGDANIEAELELIRSRMVIGRSVDALSLDLNVEPRYFPVLGRYLARQFENQSGGVSQARFGLEQFAWGGEAIAVDYMNVPESMLGSELTLRILDDQGAYELLSENNTVLVKSQVGEVGEKKFKGNGQLEEDLLIYVSSLKARPGTEFLLTKLSDIEVIDDIKANLSVSEKGKKSSMLQLAYTGIQPKMTKDVLNTIADIYVDQNVARNSAQAENSLDFLDEQLPPLKEQVDAAENAYNQYRMQHGSVDLAGETEAILINITKTSDALLDLRQQRDELRKKFKPAHPVIKALDGKIRILEEQQQKLESNTDNLPQTQRDILRLARDVELNTALYTKLLNTAQELKVAKAGTVGTVRVIDYGYTPKEAVKPNKGLVVFLSTLTAFALGTLGALILNALRGGVNDPDEIERKLGLAVYSSVTFSSVQKQMTQKAKKTGEAIGVLAHTNPDDEAIESLRSLRTSLYFSLRQAHNNLIMLTGASPKVGKSFTSVNLAAVLADASKKVVVVDADLRRGTVHRYFGKHRQHGLAEVLTQDLDILKFARRTDVDGLYVITSGVLPPNPSELLLHESFETKMAILAENFDYVVIDAPPILAVTDAAIIGQHVATTLMVIKDNFHPMRELEQATQQLHHAGIKISGAVFNSVTIKTGRYGYGQYVYRYSYGKE